MTTVSIKAIDGSAGLAKRADAIELELSGLGRASLVERIITLTLSTEAMADHVRDRSADHARVVAENKVLTEQVTDLQKKANGALASHRLAKKLADEPDLMVAMLDLAWGIDKGRAKHPNGSDLTSLISEVGEVAKAMYAETPERVLEELLDVLVVALRLRLGEIKPTEVTFASGPDPKPEVAQ